MKFITDKQTANDLNIFGGNAKDSIFGLFDHTKTRGAEAMLREMFENPLSDHHAVNLRIQEFIQLGSLEDLALEIEDFDKIEHYLANNDPRSQLPQQGSMGGRLTALVLEDPGFRFVDSGLKALIRIVNSAFALLDKILKMNIQPPLKRVGAIVNLLNAPDFKGILRMVETKLSYSQLSEMDKIFRFRFHSEVRELLNFIYYLDLCSTVTRVAALRGWVFPLALPSGNGLDIHEVSHPLVKNGIANPYTLNHEMNVTFLTGANMAGKSTFMKSIGTAIYLAHIGLPVAAKKMEFPVLDGILTTINLPDNISAGTSHFYAEVLRLKKIARELAQGKKLFVIFDELFRGTNVKDAYEATIAVVNAFAAKKDSMFIISTHIIEAADVLAQKRKNIGFSYLPTIMDDGRPVYSYKLQNGVTQDRHGMVIINNEGILKILKDGIKNKSL